jgi:hypothetical protein
MMTPREYLISIGVKDTAHGNRTFYEHLCNVEDILKLCRVDKDVCLAGLYHSIYGTNYFQLKTTDNRDAIKTVIGERAEYLVWIFCNAQRPFCWFCGNKIVLTDGSFVLVDNKTLHDLQMIEGANLLEQQCGADIITSFAAKNLG